MSEETKQKELEANFAKAIDRLNELRGGVKAFILLALTDEPSDEKEDAVRGVNAAGGKMKDLVALFNNINEDIKGAAAMKGLINILGKVLDGNEKSESKKDKEI